MNAQQREELLRATGRRLAATRRFPGDDVGLRVKRAVEVLDELGGLVELQDGDDTCTVYGLRCPFAALVRDHPEVCQLAEALLGELVGAPVEQRCNCTDFPHCCFIVQRSSGK
jgi:predicted ArsR family transcriptional regulator